MAEAIGAAIINAAGSVGVTVTASAGVVGSVAIVAAQMAYGYAEQRRAKRNARAAANDSFTDRTVLLRSAEAPHEYVYGEQKKSGTLLFAHSQVVAAREQYLWLVVALASHQSEAIDKIYLDADEIGPLDGNGDVQYGQTKFWNREISPAFETHAAAVVSGALKITVTLAVHDVLSVTRKPDGGDFGEIVLVEGAHYTRSGSVFTFLDGSGVADTTPVTVAYRWLSADYPLVRAYKYLGASGQTACAALVTASGGRWTNACAVPGETYLVLRLRYHEAVFAQWTQNVSVIMRGKLVYDPRTGATAYSNNPALCARDYLRSSIGYECASTEVIDSAISSQANICDEEIPTNGSGGTQKRYTCDVVLSSEAPLDDNLRKIISSMDGSATYAQGVWHVKAGAYRAPTLSLIAGDVSERGDETVTPGPGIDELVNCVRGKFIDKGSLWQATDYPPVISSAYVTEDGGRREYLDLDLLATIDATRAQRIAKQVLKRARQGVRYAATFKLSAYDTLPGEVVAITHPVLGWDEKPFEVVERRMSFEAGTVTLLTAETDASIFDWTYSEAVGIDPAPNTLLPKPNEVPLVASLDAVSGPTYVRTLSDGSVRALMRVTWAATTHPNVVGGGFVEVEHRRATAATWISAGALRGDATQVDIEGVSRDEVYVVRARYVTGAGIRSTDWAYAVRQVSSAAPGNTAMPAPGANRIQNAALTHDVQHWTKYVPAGMTDAVTLTRETNYGPGTRVPGAMRLNQSGTQNYEAGVQQPDTNARAFSVVAGRKYWAQAALYASQCAGGFLQLTWIDASGNAISTISGSATADRGATDPASEADFNFADVVGVAPTGAVGALFTVRKKPTNYGVQSNLYAMLPAFNEVPLAQTVRPPWSAGTPTNAGTAPRSYASASQTVTFSADNVVFIDALGPQFTAEGAGEVDVTATFEVTASSQGGASSTITVGLLETAKLTLISRQAFTVASGATDTRTMSLTSRYAVNAGDVTQPRVRMTRTRYGVGVGNNTDKLDKLEIWVTPVKR